MIHVLEQVPEPLLWSMAASGLSLVLLLLALAFVWLAMPTD